MPILKVLYRNKLPVFRNMADRTARCCTRSARRPAGPERLSTCGSATPSAARKLGEAEAAFATPPADDARAMLERLLPTLHDGCEVHRVVLVSRAWDLLDLLGPAQAHTLLRQSVRYCVRNEEYTRQFATGRPVAQTARTAPAGERRAGGTRLTTAGSSRTSQRLFTASPEDAAGIAAEALGEGFTPDAVAEAISLAANQLVLRDEGRPKGQTAPNKPVGSVHGDSIGVHACDSANAWRNIARVSSPRSAAASLLLGAYQVALDRMQRGGDFQKWEPYPRADVRERVTARDPAVLLKELDGAIREKNQPLASALAARYADLGNPADALFALLLRYAVSEDGALHAEKFYRTASEEYALTRKAFRNRQLVALARVTASAFGQPAPGYAQACALLKVTQ
ncbi:MAG: hypothetical protein U0736_17395 [Gemmataceae bacterium]